MPLRRRTLWAMICLSLLSRTWAADWPMWRGDAQRSGATPEPLPERLHLRWQRDLAPAQLAWPNEARLHFDAVHEPVVVGNTLLLGSTVDGSLAGFDTGTGAERWRFHSEGPVRLAPAAGNGRAYFGSDDGYLYCLDAASGKLLWRVRGAPDDRPDCRHLGNGRLVSYWPVRGGPVLVDDTVYFGAGIWPTLGVFIKAVDARTGRARWTNGTSHFIENVRIDHNNIHEAGLAPQGGLAAQGDVLVVPNGRSMPARFDRRTGKLLYYVQGYRRGHWRIAAAGRHVFVGEGAVVNLHDGREAGSRWVEAGKDAPQRFDGRKFHLFEGPMFGYKFQPACNARSVFESGRVYGVHQGVLYAYDLTQPKVTTYAKQQGAYKLEPARWDLPKLWELRLTSVKKPPSRSVAIKAGPRIYTHVRTRLVAVDVSSTPARVAWDQALPDTPVSMAAADGKLFVVGQKGGLYCFGQAPAQAQPAVGEAQAHAPARDEWTQVAADLLQVAGAPQGYAVLLGLGSGRLMEELLRQPDLLVMAVDPDRSRVNAWRSRLSAAGLYGSRAEVFVGDPWSFRFPRYLASLVTCEDLSRAGFNGERSPAALFRMLRPYGGVACFALPEREGDRFLQWASAAKLPNAVVQRRGRHVLLRRAGALPGAAAWTHECADGARSYFSRDTLVRAPLGVLWYGDGPGYGFYKRKDYGVGVKPQVVGGRLFSYQIASRMLHANDVYTGRLLWRTKVEHFTRYASMADGIYVAGADRCLVLDPATGKQVKEFVYQTGDDRPPCVADIRVGENVIVIAVGFDKVRVIEKGLWDSKVLVALDRATGKQLWTRRAEARFNNHALAVAGGRVFVVDSVSPIESDDLKRRGSAPKELPSTVLALAGRTGQEFWRATHVHPFRVYKRGSWLGMRARDDWAAYAAECDLLLVGKHSTMRALDAGSGREVWTQTFGGGQPLILRGDTFLSQGGHTFQVRTGKCISERSLFRRGGCNYGVANEHLVFVREFCATYVDVKSAQRHRLRNVRSGCSNSLIAADGVLSVPCFSVGCVCNYPIQTSFALVHAPEVAPWAGETAVRLDPGERLPMEP